jgi:hypothetical protein
MPLNPFYYLNVRLLRLLRRHKETKILLIPMVVLVHDPFRREGLLLVGQVVVGFLLEV